MTHSIKPCYQPQASDTCKVQRDRLDYADLHEWAEHLLIIDYLTQALMEAGI
ncbi:MAG: hypothetical protein KME21_18190 [Desmonostoc vinosum HA7617-LM4]|jgi:hypothetical protein|nr:hypothetical protein [Desmonostoc vinosum HA7617-LM4]